MTARVKPSRKRKRDHAVVKRTTHVIVERLIGHANAGCQGYMALRRAGGNYERIAWSSLVPEHGIDFGDELKVEVTITVLRAGKKSRKKCHNPWHTRRRGGHGP